MNRRQLGAGMLALALAGTALAQADDNAPVVGAPKIIEALSKDVVLDRPGTSGAPAPRRDPSISLQVQFAFGSADLLLQGRRQLDQLGLALSDRALAHAAFELAGHTDGVGDAESNLRLSIAFDIEEVVARYRGRYAGEPLVKVLDEAPWVSRIAGAHHVELGGFTLSGDGKRLVVVATEDNLLKGAATQALQNLNLAFGLDEFAGIPVEHVSMEASA